MFRTIASSTLAVLMISGPAFAQKGAVVARPSESVRETEKRDETKTKGAPKAANDNLTRQQEAALVKVESHISEIVRLADKQLKQDDPVIAQIRGLEGAVRLRETNGLKGHLKSPVKSVEQLYSLVKNDNLPVDAAMKKVIAENKIDEKALVDCGK